MKVGDRFQYTDPKYTKNWEKVIFTITRIYSVNFIECRPSSGYTTTSGTYISPSARLFFELKGYEPYYKWLSSQYESRFCLIMKDINQ